MAYQRCIVQVWFEAESEIVNRRANFAMVETDLPDFESFFRAMEADRIITGSILWTQKTGVPGEAQVTRRVPCAFRGSSVVRCQLPTWTFVQFEDEAA